MTIVSEEQFVSLATAQERLGLRTKVLLNLLVTQGELERAATSPGPWRASEIGVTAESFAPVAEWWTSAPAADRRRRFRELNTRQLRHSV